MHRSGTSLLTGLLKECGFYIGEELDFNLADESNPKGYWEHKKFLEVNELLLAEMGAQWNQPHKCELEKISTNRLKEVEALGRTIVTQMDDYSNWLVKDPRMCLTLPFWKKIIPNICVVAIYRDPLQVAESLRNRDSFPLQYGLAIWEYYTRRLLRNTANLNFVLISHKSLIEKPKATLEKLKQKLMSWGCEGLDLPSNKAINNLVDRKLFRAKASELSWLGFLTEQQAALYQAIEQNSYLDIILSEPAAATLELISDFGVLLEKQKSDIDLLNKILGERELEIQNAKLYITSSTKERALLEEEVTNAREMIRNFEIELEGSRGYTESLKVELERNRTYTESLKVEFEKSIMFANSLKSVINEKKQEDAVKEAAKEEEVDRYKVNLNQAESYVNSLNVEKTKLIEYVESLKNNLSLKEKEIKNILELSENQNEKILEAIKYAKSLEEEIKKYNQ